MIGIAGLKGKNRYLLLALLALGLIFPFVSQSSYLTHLLILSYLWAIMALAYNLLMGYTGLLSLGHAAFFAIGAYTSAIVTTNFNVPWPVGMTAAALVTAAISVPLGLLVLRLRGAYFAMVTLGFAEIVRRVIENWESLTGGVYGIRDVPPLFGSIETTYIFILLLLALVYFLIYRLIHSHIGRALIAIREDENVARSVGIDVTRYKLLAFVISTTVVAIAGAAWTHYFRYAYPDFAHFLNSAAMLVHTVVGGPGFIIGPGIAAGFFTFLPEFSRAIGDYQSLIYGVILVLVIIFIPNGLEPLFRRFFRSVKDRLKTRGGARAG